MATTGKSLVDLTCGSRFANLLNPSFVVDKNCRMNYYFLLLIKSRFRGNRNG